jgi:DNA-directed RNA polymerase subunit RPC12/RpoP
MGHKVVCLDCRKSFSQGTDLNDRKEALCPDCGKIMTFFPHRFRPPKRTDDKKWETVNFLVSKGFYYQHIWEPVMYNNKIIGAKGFVAYPDNLRDAKEFVEKYKSQALK